MPSTFRRQIKNTVNNYSTVERKVREATSNDPWGPSSSLMSEIADATYNVQIFGEIMGMIWRRLNDHGKNWRHVYKALTLLDYLIKTGSERVVVQCKENIFAIQTLKDFQYIDKDGKDQGINVREKSKQLVVLLKDEERLKAERSQALKTKERMAQVSTGSGVGFGRGSSQPNLATYSEEYGRSEGSPASYHGSTSPNLGSELEQARPQTSGEEQLQIQLALAMSREAAEQKTILNLVLSGAGCFQEERLRRGDDLRLQMALEESKKEPGSAKLPKKKKEVKPQSSLMDLMDVPEPTASVDPWGSGAGAGAGAAAASADPWQPYGSVPKPAPSVDPWGTVASVPPAKSADPWAPSSVPAPSDPWGPAAARPKTSNTGSFDLFSTSNGTSKEDFSEFDSLRSSSSVPTGNGGIASSVPSQGSLVSSGSLDIFDPLPSSTSTSLNPTRKTPESFLGPNAALVNLDSLVSKPAQSAPVINPFLASAGAAAAAAPPPAANPFQVSQPAPPTLNQMRLSPMPSGFGTIGEPITLASVPAQPITVVPLPGMTPMGRTVPGMSMAQVGGSTSVGMSAGIPASMSLPQPLMSMPPQAGTQPTGTTNPFLL
ncbi:epsin-2 isoform X3 [Boleophthalmus pectinirostris]|uniref:epsin-2 isoform X3 n=1 Tax=Boleophthalmus pectinirostris TaxID=150288 RepID=UPI00242ACFAB|nr:epsin-2 isoform X3 [Boleophthalmus pectinirostris]